MDDDAKTYRAVTVSSTFTDLKPHRSEVREALTRFDLLPKVMEHDGARADADVIDSSLGFVQDSSAFIGIISHKYGQTPACPERNPEGLSISELEFNKAMELGRPILLFIMSEDHPVRPADVERDPAKLAKLEAFRENAKRMSPGSHVERVYETFASLQDFTSKARSAIGRLAEFLKQRPASETLAPPSKKPEGAPYPSRRSFARCRAIWAPMLLSGEPRNWRR